MRRVGSTGLAGLAVIAGVLATGAVTGLVWSLVVTPTALRKTAGGLVLDEVAGATVFGATGWFCVLTAVIGIAVGAVVAPIARRSASAGVAVAGLVLAVVTPVVISLVAWWVGQRIGAGPSPATVAGMADGGTVDAPLRLGAPVALAVGPLAAVAVVVTVTAWPRRTRDRAPG